MGPWLELTELSPPPEQVVLNASVSHWQLLSMAASLLPNRIKNVLFSTEVRCSSCHLGTRKEPLQSLPNDPQLCKETGNWTIMVYRPWYLCVVIVFKLVLFSDPQYSTCMERGFYCRSGNKTTPKSNSGEVRHWVSCEEFASSGLVRCYEYSCGHLLNNVCHWL